MLTVLAILLAAAIALCIGVYALYKYKNKRPAPDYYERYKTQDTVPRGKAGIFATCLIMPETMDDTFFFNITKKIFESIMPWPFRNFAKMDKGIALLDPVWYHEHEEFTPAALIDPAGNERDLDGTPYIEKYRQGEVEWKPPSKRIYLDHGYFLYTGRKGGIPSLTGKMINKARVWYYNKGIRQQKIPHHKGMFEIIHKAFDKIKSTRGDVECKAESSLYYYDMKAKLFEMLDAGCDTIILAAPMAIYSHFEEFNSSFRHCFEYIHEWEADHPDKNIKVIMAPPMGHFQPLRTAFLEMLKDRLNTLPKNADVMVAVTVHGMPWDHFSWEAWLEMAPAYRDKLYEEVKELLERYAFNRTKAVICQDEFADPIWDPEEKYLSTNRAYWNGINEGYDYVIGLPIEFFVENTDTMFHHAVKNYHGFDNYDVYTPIDYPDWSIPYTQQFTQGKTTVIYNGVPSGKYQKYVIDAFYESIKSVLQQAQH